MDITKEVVRLYQEGTENAEIMKAFNLTKADLYRILNAEKVPRKQNKGGYKRTPLARVVCECGYTCYKAANFSYCPMCGTHLITAKQKAINTANYLKTYKGYITDQAETEVYSTAIKQLIEYITKED